MSLRDGVASSAPPRQGGQEFLPRDPELLCAVIRRHRAAAGGRRTLIGLVGEPGAGKSTLARELVTTLAGDAVLVPMDGFHLGNQVLQALGRRERKGAPDTFDAHGFVHLVKRLRDQEDEVVYAPEFFRALDEPIAASIAISGHTPVVLIEGNYLLLDDEPWREVRQFLDDVWYLDLNRSVRLRRLAERHQSFGLAPEHAWNWATSQDESNADLIRQTRVRARLVIGADTTP